MFPAADAVIFDLDGTLVDTVETRIRAWLAAFVEAGIPADRRRVAELIGSDGRRLAREVAHDARRELDDAGSEEVDRRAGEIYGELNRDPQPLPGARSALEALDARGIRWAIATSSRPEQVATSVAALGLSHKPTLVDGGRVEHAKPAPDLLLVAAEDLGAAPSGCWVVGDATWDALAGVAAGMVVIGVTAGAAVDADALREAGAAVVLETLEEFPRLLEG